MTQTSRYVRLLRDTLTGRHLIREGPDPEPPWITSRTWETGVDWPLPYPPVLSMIGRQRMDNVVECLASVCDDGVPGDVIETGVWRGGTCIMMRGFLADRDDRSRRVFAADSFTGVPPPSDKYPQDADVDLYRIPDLAVSLPAVQQAFSTFDVLDDRVVFVPGLFHDTLPALRGRRWALLRLDGDLYESTKDALEALYPALESGGYCIIDDYGAYPGCRMAVEEYRSQHGIQEPIKQVDWTGAYWRKR